MLNLTPSVLLLTTAAPLAMSEAAHAEEGAMAPLSDAAPTQSIKSGHVEAGGISSMRYGGNLPLRRDHQAAH
jgi:hypothetical protein